MKKILLTVLSMSLLSSCSTNEVKDTANSLYEKVMPRAELLGSTQESVIAKDKSSFESQGFSGDEITSSSSPVSADQIAVANLRSSGVAFTLNFAFDGSEIDEVATQEIIKHANFMRNNPQLTLRLEGHADERGTREYNLALGENRALAVKEVLGLYDLSSRVEVISFGEEKPVAQLHEESSWQKNRRVEFVYQ